MMSICKRVWWATLLILILPNGSVFQSDSLRTAPETPDTSRAHSHQNYHLIPLEQTCVALLESALSSVSEHCSVSTQNTLCYGGGSVSSMASRENMPIVFEAPFSPRDLSSIISIDTTLGVSAARTGVALVAPTNTRGDPLVMLLVGDVEMAIEPGATTFYGADGIHFTLQTSPSNTATCSNDQPPSILVARSQNATLTVNGITITFAGLVALHTTPDGGLEIALANGEARVSETLISGGSAVSALLADDGHTITGSLSAPRALSTEELELFALVADIMPLLSDENAQIAPTPTCAPHVDWPIYVVPPGETLWRIASVTGLSITELKQANCMGDQDILRAGQRFHVPRPLSPLPAAVSATSVSGATSVPGSPPGDGNSGGDNPVGQPTTAPPTCVPGTPGCDDGNIGG